MKRLNCCLGEQIKIEREKLKFRVNFAGGSFMHDKNSWNIYIKKKHTNK